MKRFTRHSHLLFLCLILVLGIISPLSFFKHNLPLVGSDTWPPLNIDLRLKEWPYVWGYFSSILGNDFSGRIVFLPQNLIYAFLHVLGFSLASSQKIIFSQIFLTAGFSMYFLAYVLWRNSFTSFVSAIIFMFNPVFAGFWQEFLPDALITFSFFPLVLALFIKGLRAKRIIVPAILFSLSTLLFLPYNLPTNVMAGGILFIFLIYELLTSGQIIKKLKFVFACIFFSLLLNVWWLFPQYIWYPQFMNYYSNEVKLPQRLVEQGFRAFLVNSFRLIGNSYWGYSLWDNKPSNYIGFLYDHNSLLIFASFLYPFFAFFSLMFYKKEKKVVFLSFSALLFLFLSKALNRPLGGIYQFLFDRFPGFYIFRTPSDKFWLGVLIFYSLLIGYSLTQIYLFLEKKYSRLSKLLVGTIVIIFLLFQWPFFTGDVIPNGKSALPTIEFNLPKYYSQLASWLGEQKDSFRLINLPGANRPTRWLNYKWGFWGVYPILSEVLGKPIIEKQPQEPSDLLRLSIYQQLGNSSEISTIIDQKTAQNNSIDKILGLLNVKYLLINYDSDWEHLHFGTEQPQILEEKLNSQKNVVPEQQFGNIHLYKIDQESVFPDIYSYIPGNETYYCGNPKLQGNLFAFDLFSPESGFYVSDCKTVSEKNKIFVTTDYQYFRDDYKRNYTDFPYFPFLRFLPGNPLYFITEWKDLKRQNSSAVDSDMAVETLISLADKRLAEVKHLLEKKNFNKSVAANTLRRYKDHVEKTLDIFLNNVINEQDSFSKAQQLSFRLNCQENFLQSLSLTSRTDSAKTEILTQSLKNFNDWYGFLNKYLIPWWFDQSQNYRGQVAYSFHISQEGDYQVFLNTGDLTNLNYNSKGDMVFSGEIRTKSGGKEKITWQSRGKVLSNQWEGIYSRHFLAGDYTLTIDNQETANLCQDCSWNILEIPEISESINLLKTSEGNFRIISSQRTPGVIYTWLLAGDVNDTFRISFSYRNISGKPLSLISFKSKYSSLANEKLLEEFNKNQLLVENRKTQAYDGINKFENSAVHVFSDQELSLGKESQWQTKIIDFKPGEGARIFGFAFFVRKDNSFGFESDNEIKDFRIEKVFNNPIVLFKDSQSNSSEERPEISFKRINPTRYEISVNARHPYNLVFGQSFNPQWKLYFADNVKLDGPIVRRYDRLGVSEVSAVDQFFSPSFLFEPENLVPEKNHFIVDGYANAWKIDKTGNYKLILEYYPQLLFYRIGFVSVLTLFSFIIFLILLKRR